MCVFRCVCLLLCVSVCVCLNLLDEAVTFSGPTGSLFGFSVDFHTISNKPFVVIGAPKTNTSQSGVMEGGGVFLCPISSGGGTCDIINFDLKGDEDYSSSGLFFHAFKSQQWFGASVRSVSSSHLLACAPLFHWNAQMGGAESGKTPVGNCLLLDHRTGRSTTFSPCRGIMMEFTDNTLLVPGQVFTVSVSDIINSGESDNPIQYVASYFGHSVAVADINSDGLDDVLIGAPLYMDRVMEQLQERGQVVVYLQRRHATFASQPDQSLIGLSLYGRFGSTLAILGDLDMDGYHDVAVGAPWSGVGGRGQVFIYLGNRNGLSATPSQVIDSPLPSSRTAFGFTLRGGADIDKNGYPDLLVGAWAADRAFVYRFDVIKFQNLANILSPHSFVIQMCVHVSGHRIPQETALWVDLQLDKMKQPMARRTLLLSTNQPQEMMKLMVQREVGVACVNQTAYLREVRDKLSPIFITANISLLNTTQHALLYGQTHAAAQTRIILDCGDDNICVPDLKLRAEPVLVGGDQLVVISVSAENDGEGAYETELVVRVPEHTHFQSTMSFLLCNLLFSVGRLEEVQHITFSLRIRSKNLVNSSSEQVQVQVQVRSEAMLEIRGGSSPPEVVLPLPDWQPAMHPGSLEEVGPLVEHVYELRNQGPSAVNARLTVDFPSTWQHRLLLYIFSNASEESLSCWTLNASQIDPFKVQDLSLNCSSSETGCVRFVCDVTVLGRGLSAVVRISARLWTHTLKQTPYLNYELVSSASYDVINTLSMVQPTLLPSGHTQVVIWRRPDGEKEVPVGYIILSIISGLLLLGLLCFIFWKLGFFQRTRPPTDDGEDNDEEQQQLAEQGHMTE
uniref:Integrin alpha-IIb-like n=1 Tax=Seriola lalandi dorsalis TaxID=1841481 RepID=A0A3B4XS13_SERLL